MHALRHAAPAGPDDHRRRRPPARPRAGKERPGGGRRARREPAADQSTRRLHARGRRQLSSNCTRRLTARASTLSPAREKKGEDTRRAPRRNRRAGAEKTADSESDALGRLRAPVRAPGAQPDPPARRPCRRRRSARAAQRPDDDGPPLPVHRRDRHRHPAEYVAKLAAGKVIASFAERRASIAAQLDAAAKRNSMPPQPGRRPARRGDGAGRMAGRLCRRVRAEYLEVPQECLILTMQQNQKYFPLLDAAASCSTAS
jgi:hypothetical protein